MIVGYAPGPHLVNTELRRISIRAGTTAVDLALPPDVPMTELIPSVYDILTEAGAALPQLPYRLHRPGHPALDASMSLSQLGIDDGALLVLTSAAAEPPAATVLHAADAAERMAGTDDHTWTPERSRLAALLIATTLAATTGLLAVPGGVGAPSLLLSAAAATAAATLGCRATRYGRTVLMAVTALGALTAVATVGATLFEVRTPVAGVALATLSVGVLSVSGRLAILISGLSGSIAPDLNPDTDGPDPDIWGRSARAQQLLTALVVAASAASALGGAAVTFGTDRQLPDFLLTATLAMLLTVRCRVHRHPARRAALLIGGLLCTTTLFIGLRLTDPGLTPWLCTAAVALIAGTLWLGFAPPRNAGAAPMRRGLDLLDCALLVAVIPLACWSCGLDDVVRGLAR